MQPDEIQGLRFSLGLNQEEFAKLLGVSKRSVVNYESGDTAPNAKALFALNKVKQDAREKEMGFRRQLHDVPEPNMVKEPDAHWISYSNYKMVPLVSHRAQAGFLAGWGDDEYVEDLPKVPWEVDREYKGRYVCFEVSGDSMDDNTPEALLEGDIILCREVQRHHWQHRLHIDQWDFVIVHRDHGIVVKRITEHDTTTGDLVLHSLNDLYDDYTVNLNECIAIFNVVDVKRSRRR